MLEDMCTKLQEGKTEINICRLELVEFFSWNLGIVHLELNFIFTAVAFYFLFSLRFVGFSLLEITLLK